MYCDCSAYYQKAIKATARRLKVNTHLLAFFAFWAIVILPFKAIRNYISSEVCTLVIEK
jgi:hypothetical protein